MTWHCRARYRLQRQKLGHTSSIDSMDHRFGCVYVRIDVFKFQCAAATRTIFWKIFGPLLIGESSSSATRDRYSGHTPSRDYYITVFLIWPCGSVQRLIDVELCWNDVTIVHYTSPYYVRPFVRCYYQDDVFLSEFGNVRERCQTKRELIEDDNISVCNKNEQDETHNCIHPFVHRHVVPQ